MDRRAAASLLLLLLVAALQQNVRAYSEGAPNSDKVCTTLVPGHRNTTALTGGSFFVLAASPSTRGNTINVTLTSRQGFPFKGFMVQGRAANSQEPIGSFILHDTAHAQVKSCLGGADNTVTHTDPAPKTSATFEWIPPPGFNDEVVFNATVVQNYSTFWTGVIAKTSASALTGSTVDTFNTNQPLVTPRTSTTSAPATSKPVANARALSSLYEDCGVSKACFGSPSKCESKGNCQYMTTVLERGNKFVFELMTSGDVKYVAVGLSNNQLMGGDLVMECVLMSTGEVKVFQSWNTANKRNERVPTNNDLETLNATYVDDTIYCQFERNAITTVNNTEFNLPETKYYLLLATSINIKDDGVGYHNDIAPVVSAKSSLLSDVNGFSAASKLLLRLHGAFMIAAWIGAASIGIVLARYFKQTWTGSQLCGKDQWFAWHRIFMVLVWCLTITAFVLIFVEIKAWSSGAKNHAILGIITTALAFFQPIGAIFRPSPDSRKRPIFNWLHWFVGNSAHIFGIVSIFLAGQLGKAELPSWWIWIMVGYVAFHVLMHLMFSIAGCISERQSSKRINSFPMKEISNSRSPLASAERRQEAPHSCFRKFLLAVYIFGILAITIALIVIAALAPIEENVKIIQELISPNSSG